MGSAMTIDEEVRLALQYSINYAEAAPYLNKAAKEHITGLCALVEKQHKLLADKAGARVDTSNVDGDWTRRLAKEFCPITKRPFFMAIEHPDLGWVATYGGPFDSFTIPEPDEDGSFRSERFDHDAGDWVEGGNPEPYELLSEREFNELWDKACRLKL